MAGAFVLHLEMIALAVETIFGTAESGVDERWLGSSEELEIKGAKSLRDLTKFTIKLVG